MTLLVATCASAPAGTTRSGVVEKTPSGVVEKTPSAVSVVLAIGASKRVPDTNLTVKFEAVVADSRCPTGTTCVWAGDTAVKIQMTAPKTTPASAVLHTNLRTAPPVVHDGWRIKLIGVTPAPTADGPPRPEDYRITLLIDRQ